MIGLTSGYELWRLRRWRLRFLALSNAPRSYYYKSAKLLVAETIQVGLTSVAGKPSDMWAKRGVRGNDRQPGNRYERCANWVA